MINRSSPVTMYHQVRQSLERRILETGMQTGDRLPSVRELIETYGVSLPVVRQAISELEKDGIVRVEHGRGSFVARLPEGSQGDVPASLHFISCSHDLFDPYYARVLHGVQAAAAQHEIQLVCAHPTEQRPLDRLLDTSRPRGVILAGEITDEILATVRERALPCVVAGDIRGHALQESVSHIANDDYDGGYQAGQHLMTMGHRHIGVIAGSQDLGFWRLRLDGFRAALQEHGVILEDSSVCILSHDRAGEGARAAARLLSRDPAPTAIFASNDRFAYGVYAYLLNHGARVPENCSVVGFDDLDLSIELSPPLTTVRLDIEGVGERAVDALMQRIADPSIPPVHLKLPVSLVRRGSVVAASVMSTLHV